MDSTQTSSLPREVGVPHQPQTEGSSKPRSARREPEENKKGTFSSWLFKENSKKKEEDGKTASGPPPVVVMDKVPQRVLPKPARTRNENDSFRIELIELLLRSYFKIVRKNIKDRVPKSIMHFMVNASKEKIQNELVKELYKEDLFGTLLEESDDVAQRRERLRETIQVLTTAHKHLNEIIDYKL